MLLYIIRHGDPDYALDSLTPKGFKEAELLAHRLSKFNINDFYCSPLGRAIATAKPTLDLYEKDATILDWLQEFRGTIKSPYTEKERIMWDLPPHLWCNDERCYSIANWHDFELISQGNSKAIYDETTLGIDSLLRHYGLEREKFCYKGNSEKCIALFCHFGLGILILSYLTNISPMVALHNFFLAPTSVTSLVTETDSNGYSHFRAIGVGDISHLYTSNEPMSESGLYPNFYK